MLLPEPQRHGEKDAARVWLKEQQVPFLPFYEAVEFNENVDALTRERIEAASGEMGLLDALIVPEEARSRLPASLADSVIPAGTGYSCATLVDYLHPLPPQEAAVLPALIDEALRSILINDEQITGRLLAQEGGAAPVLSVRYGAYRTGLLAGQAPRQESALFIGREARKQYRLQEIARLEGKRRHSAKCWWRYSASRLEEIEQALRELQRCWEGLPKKGALDAANREWLGRKQALSICESDAAQKMRRCGPA